jgi:hypothetical protein
MKTITLSLKHLTKHPACPAVALLHIPLLLACFALLPTARAVSPAPDGGYPGGNTAEGTSALLSRTTGLYNTAVGLYSLLSLTDGNFCTGVGAGTLLVNTADNNTATGAAALLGNTSGAANTASGAEALVSNTSGDRNTANGFQALFSNTTGGFNTAVGVEALSFNATGNFNIALGVGAGTNVTTANNVICIGSAGSDVSDTTWINNIYGVTTVFGTTLPVVVSDGGQLGTASSSRRFKKEIKPMEKASESLLALKPVTFHYKSDVTGTRQFGLIAEEVAEVNPDLVARDSNGEIYTVRYDAVNAMLLNEFLKEHGKNKKQEAIIAELRNDVKTLAAKLKEQAAQIQKASNRVGLTRSGPQMVLNNQ